MRYKDYITIIDGVREDILQSRTAELSRFSVQPEEVHKLARDLTIKGGELNLSTVIERCLEKAVISPLHDKIIGCISTQTKDQGFYFSMNFLMEDELIRKRIDVLRQKEPDFFGMR